ncbi:MAG TPA: GNAT family N-acetyltransferase [Calditrichae bacterium]|nr:GNAT family N-acetyltransferase [Calditrichia bacterium]
MATEWLDIPAGDDSRWRHFLHEVPAVPFSWDERFLTVMHRVFRYHPRRLLLLENNQPRAGGVFFVRRRLGKEFSTVPFFAFYLPVIATAPSVYHRMNDVAQFLEHVEHQFHMAECVSMPGTPLCLPYVWRGWEIQVQASGLLPIGDPEETLQAMDSEERRLIRKARKMESLTVIPSTPAAAFYDLLQGVYGRHDKKPPLSRRQFERFITALKETELGVVPGIEANGMLQAATVVIPYGNTVYGLMLARRLDTTGSLAALKLIWHVMTTYSAAGLEWYDLGGMEIPSIAQFKLKLGALPRVVYRCRFIRNRQARMLRNLASLKNKTLRNLW